MNRRAALALLTGGACLTTVSGCLHDTAGGITDSLSRDHKPKPSKFSPASLQIAQRVENLGRRIIDQNTFTGLDPLFHTIGVPEPMLFHRGPSELFISEGLVKKCKTEDDLAAVLCSELAQMMAERRTARGVGRDRDTLTDTGQPGGAFTASGTQAAELTPGDKLRDTAAPAPADVTAMGKQLLTGAGFDPDHLDRVGPLLSQSDRGEILRKQLAGSAPAPTWKK